MIIPENEMKHPLENEWSFWLFTNEKQKWEENLVELTTFKTVEDYWCLYHHMKLPSELKCGQDYAVFKKGIRPMWEDDANEKGGRWQIMFDNFKYSVMDSIWLDLVLLLIGENFKYSGHICGVVVNVRQKSKLSIWMNTCKNTKAVLEVGRNLRKHLSIPNRLHFYTHNSNSSAYTY